MAAAAASGGAGGGAGGARVTESWRVHLDRLVESGDEGIMVEPPVGMAPLPPIREWAAMPMYVAAVVVVAAAQ